VHTVLVLLSALGSRENDTRALASDTLEGKRLVDTADDKVEQGLVHRLGEGSGRKVGILGLEGLADDGHVLADLRHQTLGQGLLHLVLCNTEELGEVCLFVFL